MYIILFGTAVNVCTGVVKIQTSKPKETSTYMSHSPCCDHAKRILSQSVSRPFLIIMAPTMTNRKQAGCWEIYSTSYSMVSDKNNIFSTAGHTHWQWWNVRLWWISWIRIKANIKRWPNTKLSFRKVHYDEIVLFHCRSHMSWASRWLLFVHLGVWIDRERETGRPHFYMGLDHIKHKK